MTTEVNSSEEEAVESTEGEAARVEPAAADEKPDTAPVTEATMAEATDVAAEAAEAAADGDDVMVVDEEEGAAEAAPAEPSLADVLTAKLAQVEAERDRTRDQLIRTAADFDNFRKRSRRELGDAQRKGKEDTLREILSVIDNLERAVQAAETAADAKSVADGVRMVLRQFEEIAGRLQLERIRAVGERFDPSLHDAVQQVETADVEPGTITVEVVSGYRMGDRLLRPAVVVVATAPAAPPPAPEADAAAEPSAEATADQAADDAAGGDAAADDAAAEELELSEADVEAEVESESATNDAAAATPEAATKPETSADDPSSDEPNQ